MHRMFCTRNLYRAHFKHYSVLCLRLSEKENKISDLQGELAELRDLVELHRRKNNVSVTLTVDIILGLLSTCMFYRKHSQNRSVLNIDTPYCPLTLSPTCFKVG